jgi:ABC-type uncharacterized transport system involved in gliding motility auxiliary subunit
MSKTRISIQGILVAVALFFAVNIIASRFVKSVRLDLTENGLYTLSQGSRNILDDLAEPITLRYYFSRNLATDVGDLADYGRRVHELLEEYEARAGGNITLVVIDPEPFSEEEDRARGFGLQGVPINQAGQTLYFGLAGTNSVDDEETIPFFQMRRERFLEYDLTRLVDSLGNPSRTVVGLMSSLPIRGAPFNPINPGQAPQPWFIVEHLNQLFDLRDVSSSMTVIEDDIDVLLLVHPRELDEDALYAIDQFVLDGGRLIAFYDPHCEAQNVPQDPQNPLSAMVADRSSNLGPLLEAWGVKVDREQLIGDRECAQRVGWQNQAVDYVLWMALDEDNLDADNPITADLTQINLATAGSIEALEGATTTLEPLLITGTTASTIERMQAAMGPNPARLLDSYIPMGQAFTLAARISGPVNSAFPDGRPYSQDENTQETAHLTESAEDIQVLLVADADLLADRWWVNLSNFFGMRMASPTANNGDFVANAVENLSGSSDLISLRSRGKFRRPFDRVNDMRRIAEDKHRAKQQELEAKLQETERKLTELQGQQGSGGMILSAQAQEAIQNFRDERSLISKQLREVKHQLIKDIESLGGTLKLLHIGVLPLLVGLIAVGMGLRGNRKGH